MKNRMYLIDSTTGEVIFTFDPMNEMQVTATMLIIIERYADKKYFIVSPSGATDFAMGIAKICMLDRAQ